MLDAEREAELADQKRIADARKRTAQVALAGLVIALLVAARGGLAIFQGKTRRRDSPKWRHHRAGRAPKDARDNLSEAQIAQSRFLADLARESARRATPGPRFCSRSKRCPMMPQAPLGLMSPRRNYSSMAAGAICASGSISARRCGVERGVQPRRQAHRHRVF